MNACRIAVLGIFALAALSVPQPALAAQPSSITQATCEDQGGYFSKQRGYRICTYERTSTQTSNYSRTSDVETILDPSGNAIQGHYWALFTQTNVYSFTETCKQQGTNTPVCETTEPVVTSQNVTPTGCLVVSSPELQTLFSLPISECEARNLYAPG